MAKSRLIRQSQSICVILFICLVSIALHVVVDCTGDFTLARLIFQSDGLAELASHSHAHEDDFLLPPPAVEAGFHLAVAELVAPHWKTPSRADAPVLPPPKSI